MPQDSQRPPACASAPRWRSALHPWADPATGTLPEPRLAIVVAVGLVATFGDLAGVAGPTMLVKQAQTANEVPQPQAQEAPTAGKPRPS